MHYKVYYIYVCACMCVDVQTHITQVCVCDFILPVGEFSDTSLCHMSTNEGIDEIGGVLIGVG